MNGESGAGVVTAPPPTTAPHKERYFDRVDESSPEYQRERNMAPDLRQDFNMMEQRKRVSMILQSPAFCDELETMIQDQLKKGKTPTSLLALQQIADFMTTSMPSMYPAAPQGGMAALNMSLGMVTPVNDLRGSDSISYDKGEKLLRCKLAAFYRLADLFGWSELIYNHLTVRVNSEDERFLIVPFGLLYSEVTASSLVKINLQSEVIDRGSTNLGVNQAGFILHSSIYASRPDAKCIVHIHTAAGAAVSAMKCGLLPISPEALSLGEVAYHDYHGILVDKEESVQIQKNLGPKSKVLILRNHGLVTLGETVEEAFYYIHNLVTACEIQVRTLASAGGPDNLVMLDPAKYKSRSRVPEPVGDGSSTYPKWQVGEQEFEALMRMLDNLGYRTGYPYRCPSLRDKGKKYSDAEIAPSAHGGYSYGEDSDSGARSPLKHSFQRGQRDKTRWLNASGRPDEPYEDGPDGSSPKSKPKVWTNITHDHVKPLLQSLSSGVCVPSCITNCLWTKEEGLRQAAVANQFIPLNTNPKDVLEMRNKIREQNLQDIKTAGPQSQVLCAGNVGERSFTQGELVTASKAIIEKEYQPKVIISKQGPNPFTKITDQEVEEYRREVEQKQRGPEVQGRDASRGGSASGVSCPEPETPQRGQASVSTLLQSTTDSPSLEQVPPTAATPATPASEQISFSMGLSSGVVPARDGTDSAGTLADDVFSAPDSPHKEFHSAVLRALSKEPSVVEAAQAPDPEQLVEAVEEPKGQKATSTPPSTPIRAEEESLPEPSDKDESDAATLRQTLPDLTPDDPSDAPALPAEDSASAPDPATAEAEAEAAEVEEAADAGDQEGDESPSKSPSKKKKKFRTPSFLKKNKKKTES
ncbi:alpha-adducin isoform X1 [Scophthalmus maximus]|uniref:alpha-adducin isoform X1 n=1 Tax=Scophthalmus maximus TaxID=52904 RepID=UPI0015E134A5|nr:alpha-adducin isoform X1 [Scophthalmus maximus]